jgi:hypothetical protein
VITSTFSPESLGVASKFRGALFYCRLELAREHENILEREHVTDKTCGGSRFGQWHR